MTTLWNANSNWLLSACRDQSSKVNGFAVRCTVLDAAAISKLGSGSQLEDCMVTVMTTLWYANGNWLLSACRDQSLKVNASNFLVDM